MKEKRVLILSVCHNSYLEALNYLKSIDQTKNNEKFYIEIILLDNSSNIDDQEILKKYIPKRIVLSTHRVKNDGYFPTIFNFVRSNNINLESFDFIFITNTDLIFERNFFVNLDNLQVDKNVGLIAPQIFSNQLNVDKNPKINFRPKKIKLLFNRFLFGSRILFFCLQLFNALRVRRRYKRTRKSKKGINANEIYAAHGAFFIFTGISVKNFLDFDYPIFLFGEEIHVAEILRKSDLKTLYIPDLIIYDLEHVSTSKLPKKDYLKNNRYALNYLINKYNF